MLVMRITSPALATLVGISGAMLGLWLTDVGRRTRVVVPFSAGVLLGVALFGLVHQHGVVRGWIWRAVPGKSIRASGVSHLRARSRSQLVLDRASRFRRATDRRR